MCVVIIHLVSKINILMLERHITLQDELHAVRLQMKYSVEDSYRAVSARRSDFISSAIEILA